MTLPRWPALLCLALTLWVGAFPSAQAQSLLPVPALSARVIDQTGTLDGQNRGSH